MPHAKSCVVLPARLASTRLPEKMLLNETGRPLIEHTYLGANAAERPDRVIVATDDDRIRQCVTAFGGEVAMTSPECQSGTDRVAEVAEGLEGTDIFVNVQGDEPEIEPAAIDQVITLLETNPDAEMATVAAPVTDDAVLTNPGCVKIALGAGGRALYFSRSPIPFVRDAAGPTADPSLHFLHVGLYAFRRDFLLRLAKLPPSRLEQAERLEQLRALEAGATILVGMLDVATPGIDTREDYDAFVQRWRAKIDAAQA